MSKNYNTTLQTNNSSLEEIIIQLNNMPEAGDGLDTSDATATTNDILNGKTAYVDGEKITGTIDTKTAEDLIANGATVTVPTGYYGTQATKTVVTATQATPTVTIDSTNGLITATTTQDTGYVTGGTKSGTKQLAFQAAKTITPGTTDQTAVGANYYTGGAITVKGDGNLVAENIKNGVDIFGVTGTYEGTGGGSGGDTSMEDGIITRNITNTYENNRITSIGSYAFAFCSSLKSVNFPNVITLGSNAFQGCFRLTSVNFPQATTIGGYAFQSCSRLTSVNFPQATSIGSYAFRSCSMLTTVSFLQATSIGGYAFQGCSSLATVSFPRATSISDNAFQGCFRLTSVNFPQATTIGRYAFQDCSSLATVSFPQATTIGSYAFRSCSSLATVSFPRARTIGSYAFSSCTKLSKIYLENSIICSLAHSNVFSNTGIGSNKGSIFVPASLLASYKAATNWTYFSNRIFSYAF